MMSRELNARDFLQAMDMVRCPVNLTIDGAAIAASYTVERPQLERAGAAFWRRFELSHENVEDLVLELLRAGRLRVETIDRGAKL